MTVQNDELSDQDMTADADLILRTRSGDSAAFGELWRRHYASGMAVARSVTSSIDPDDLVQESYTRIYHAIIKGGGPNGSFRAYLFTSIRNTAAAWGRSRRETAMDEFDTVPDPDSTEQAADEALDRGLTAQAFRSLPTRWQEVLWYTEIEQMKPAEVGPLLGMKAGAVSQLAFRARDGLREAWVQAHLRSAAEGSDCRWAIERLGAHSLGNLGARDRKRLDEHLEHCARCMIVAAEAKDVSSRLALVLLPLVLGVSGAAGYTAMLQGGGVPIVALAAMPSAVVDGAVTVAGSGVHGGAAGIVVGDMGGKSAAGGASGAGASGGTLTGIGALVGAGSAALVVAGVVAATAIVPGLLNASPVTSLPNAGGEDSSSISSDVVPDDALDTEEKYVLEIEEEAPIKEPETAPEDEVPGADTAPETVSDPPIRAALPVTPTQPADPGTVPGDGGDGEVPGDGDGGEPDPGEPDPDPATDPSSPTAPLSWSKATVKFDWSTGKTHFYVPIAGIAAETVQATINGSTDGADRIELDAAGQGIIDLRPTFPQLWDDETTVAFQYVTPDGDGKIVEAKLWDLPADPAATAQVIKAAQQAEATPAPELNGTSAEAATSPASAAAPVPDVAPAPADEALPVEEPAAEEPTAEVPPSDAPAAEEPSIEAPATEAPAPQSADPAPAEASTEAPAEDAIPAE